MEGHRNNNNGRRPPLEPPSTPKTLQKERVFGGANKVKLSEEDASKLIGGILEKGISDNFTTPLPSSSFLRPSSLPFPVARHRSHGPHWTPVSQSAIGGDVDEDDDEGSDPTEYEPLADFAKPIKKKKKKGVDLSRWKEFVPNDFVPKGKNRSSEKVTEIQHMDEVTIRATDESSLANEQPMVTVSKNDSRLDVRESELEKLSYNAVDMCTDEFSGTGMVSQREKNSTALYEPCSTGSDQGHMNLESQIDAENRALLEKMTPEDIAEAQAEIRHRIKPELLDILKKRAVTKLEKNKMTADSGTDEKIAPGGKQADKNERKTKVELSTSESIMSPPPEIPAVQNALVEPDKGGVGTSKVSSLWDAWSERVEAVRNLRFSLDGNIIEGSSLGSTYTADNVAERDYLRTEGDPGAAGYTIKEALALARSVIPGQRALALHLIASILKQALHSICRSHSECKTSISHEIQHVDWKAIWAYALGPEPELILSLRLAIDDNHDSVVLASAEVIRCILACNMNEDYFNSLTKLARKDLYTAPVFRSRPDIKHGFLGGGFWKYSAKPSNILPPGEELMTDNDEKRTIQDDNILAGQDVVAGLVRMEILSRFCFLLETDPSSSLEECILSILAAIARHSPMCANAIWKSEGLIQTIAGRFNLKDSLELQASKIKSVTLFRVLAQSSRSICIDFIKKGFFQIMTWQLYRVTSSIEEWVNLGRGKCKIASELMVEQLRFWKVCVMYGHCISSFTGFFPALCLWLNPPTFSKLTEANVFNEFSLITTEVYLVLETLASRLPDLYSQSIANQHYMDSSGDDVETWCWSDVRPMVDSALQWLELKAGTALSKFFDQQTGVIGNSVNCNTSPSSLLWILSAVLHFLHTVLKKATPVDELELKGSPMNGKMSPEFISKLALQIIKNDIVKFSDQNGNECLTEHSGMGSFVEKLSIIRHQSDSEASLASVWCLNKLVCVVVSTELLIQKIEDKVGCKVFQEHESGTAGKILHDGILKCSQAHWMEVLSEFMNLVTSKWHLTRQIEVFGRGGPAPGIGMGWGASGGGFWSLTFATVQADARLLIELLSTFDLSPFMDLPGVKENFMVQTINAALASSLVMGPGDEMTVQKILDILLQVPVLKYLDQCISHFLRCSHGQDLMKGKFKDENLMQFAKILASHFTNRWLALKKRKKNHEKSEIIHENSCGSKRVNRDSSSLATIPEDMETSDTVTWEYNNSLTIEWARQRMPFPIYWFLSPIASVCDQGVPPVQDPAELLEVAKAGVFFLLGIEVLSSRHSEEDSSPVQSIPLIWKLHSLSVPLLGGMGLLEDESSRDMYEGLQSLYGQYLDELQFSKTKTVNDEAEISEKTDMSMDNCLRFQSEIHENYSTFIETLVEQFAAVSYGDVIYGRQIAIYLHRLVDSSVRLATWNALSNARVLELLPPLDKCLSWAQGYLKPVEDDDSIVEAYVKSWVAGSLDRCVRRGSMPYTVALHHLSSFFFNNISEERSPLRNKLVKSLLRDYSRKKQHEEMMLDLIQYDSSLMIQKNEQMDYISSRFELLKEACEGNSQLLSEVDKLKSSLLDKQSTL